MLQAREEPDLESLDQWAKLTCYRFVQFRESGILSDKLLARFKESFSPQTNPKASFKSGEGRSGSFFFFSHDGNYILKTATEPEIQQMIALQYSLHQHHSRYPDSLIAKIYGVFSLEVKYEQERQTFHFLMMDNVQRI